MTAHGNLNLIPLVDILTSIVFFSLLTYTGAALAALTAFDLVLPPVVITQEQAVGKTDKELITLLVAVRIMSDGVQVEHSEGLNQQLAGTDAAALDRLQALMTQIREQYASTQNRDVTVVPNDDVSYERVIQVLERLRLAGYSGLSLSNRARAVASTAPAGGSP